MTTGIVAVVLAAGESRRLGHPKQLVVHRGRALVRAAAEEAAASRCDRVVVVLGARAHAIRPALRGLPVDVLVNREWQEGLASSIRRGADWAWRVGGVGVLLLVCDQPALTARHLDRLVDAHAAGAPIAASRYAEDLGVPALFDRALYPALAALRGDHGAKHVLRAEGATSVDWNEGALDVDTGEDLERMQSGTD